MRCVVTVTGTSRWYAAHVFNVFCVGFLSNIIFTRMSSCISFTCLTLVSRSLILSGWCSAHPLKHYKAASQSAFMSDSRHFLRHVCDIFVSFYLSGWRSVRMFVSDSFFLMYSGVWSVSTVCIWLLFGACA